MRACVRALAGRLTEGVSWPLRARWTRPLRGHSSALSPRCAPFHQLPILTPPLTRHLEDSASPFYARERRFAKTDGGSGDRTSASLACLLRKHHVCHATHTQYGYKTRSNCLNGRTREGERKKKRSGTFGRARCLSQSHRFGSRVRIRSFTHPCLVILLLRSVPHSAAE